MAKRDGAAKGDERLEETSRVDATSAGQVRPDAADLGFAGRKLRRAAKAGGAARQGANQIIGEAAAALAGRDMADRGDASSGEKPARSKRAGSAPRRTAAEQASDRAWQAILGTVLPTRRDTGAAPVEPGELAAAVDHLPDEEAGRLAGLAAAWRGRQQEAATEPAASAEPAAASTASPGRKQEVADGLETELAARGITLSMSGRVNNVYITGNGSTLAVHPSAEADKADPGEGGMRSYRRSGTNNFGQLLARKLEGFIRGA